MKRHLFKIVLGGFIVFLTLPLIFDGDGQEAKTKAQTSSASTAEQEQQAVLPVVQKALPFRSENVLSKYAGRFKRFYINPQETKQQISQAPWQWKKQVLAPYARILVLCQALPAQPI